jgi:hypothetical protein
VNVELYKGGTAIKPIAANVPVGSSGYGSANFTVPNTLPAGTDYTVRVQVVGSSTFGESGQFTVGTPVSITVTQPVAGDLWSYFSPQIIYWQSAGLAGQFVNVELYKGGFAIKSIAVNVPLGSSGYGSANFTVPNTLPAGTDYTVRVQVAGSLIFGESGQFTVGTPVSITVTQPIAGDLWSYFSPQIIYWQSAGLAGQFVNVGLYKGGTAIKSIAANVPHGSSGYGSANFTVPNTLPAGTDYTVRVQVVGSSIFGESGQFTVGTPGSITVTQPVGGDFWAYFSPQTIYWQSAGLAGQFVNVGLYKGGTAIKSIAANVPLASSGYGSANFTVPSTLSAGTDYTVRVQVVGSSIFASSGQFTLGTPVSITVIQPVARDFWSYFSPQTIYWQSSGLANRFVNVELYKAGTAIKSIAINVPLCAGINRQVVLNESFKR